VTDEAADRIDELDRPARLAGVGAVQAAVTVVVLEHLALDRAGLEVAEGSIRETGAAGADHRLGGWRSREQPSGRRLLLHLVGARERAEEIAAIGVGGRRIQEDR